MTEKKLKVTHDSEQVEVPVRRRNPQGSEIVATTISLPKELNQTINGIVIKTTKSRSLVITELIEKGLNR